MRRITLFLAAALFAIASGSVALLADHHEADDQAAGHVNVDAKAEIEAANKAKIDAAIKAMNDAAKAKRDAAAKAKAGAKASTEAAEVKIEGGAQ